MLISEFPEGKAAGAVSLLFIVLLALKVSAHQILPMPLPIFGIAIIGVAGLILGVVSMARHKDRAILTILSILVGLVILLWSTAELMFPH